jgi:hypothetical protein
MWNVVTSQECGPRDATEFVVVFHGGYQISERRWRQDFCWEQRMANELAQHASTDEKALGHGFVVGEPRHA